MVFFFREPCDVHDGEFGESERIFDSFLMIAKLSSYYYFSFLVFLKLLCGFVLKYFKREEKKRGIMIDEAQTETIVIRYLLIHTSILLKTNLIYYLLIIVKLCH